MRVLLRRRGDIEAEAADWVVRLAGGVLSDHDHCVLQRWLDDDPAHAAAFAHARSTWADLDALKAAPGELTRDLISLAPLPFGVRRRRSWVTAAGIPRAAAALSIIILAVGIGAFWLGNPLIMLQADYRTSPGQTRSVVLSDGSTVELDTDSAIAVHFDRDARRVALLAGEAYFTVAPTGGTEARPFIVDSGNGTARALGTQFMVEQAGADTTVTVAEHQVEVWATSAAEAPRRVTLRPGQSVSYDRASGIGPVTQANLGERTAWRRGRLIFDDVELGQVVAALNRHRRGRIVVLGDALAHRHVSGVFEIADLDRALGSIAKELGAHTATMPPFVTILF